MHGRHSVVMPYARLGSNRKGSRSWAGSRSEVTYANAIMMMSMNINQVVLGFGTLIAGITPLVSMCEYAAVPVIGAGIWTGGMFVIAGAFGIGATAIKLNGLILTSMVLNIMAAALSTCTLGFGEAQIREAPLYDCTQETMGILLVIFAVAEAVVAIVSAALCGYAICDCRRIALVCENCCIHGCQVQNDRLLISQPRADTVIQAGGAPANRYPANTGHPGTQRAYAAQIPSAQNQTTQPGQLIFLSSVEYHDPTL